MTIRDFLNILLKRWPTFQMVVLAYLVVVTLGSLLLPVSYTSTATLLVQSKKQEMSQLDKDNPTISRAIAITLADVLSEVEVLLGEELRYRVIDELELASEPPQSSLFSSLFRSLSPVASDEAANTAMWATHLENNLVVEPASNASVMVISFTDASPERAAKVVNGITSSYFAFRLTLAQQEPLLEQLQREREESLRELRDAQQNLRAFDAESALVATGTQKDELLELLADIELEVVRLTATLEAERAEIRSLEQALKGYDEGIRKMDAIREDQGIQYLEERLSALQIELSNLLMYHMEKHSDVQRVGRNIAEVESKLREKSESIVRSMIFSKRLEVDSMQSELKTYRAIQGDIDAKLASIRSNEIGSDALVMELRIKQDNFTMISKRLDQVRFESALGKAEQLDVIVTSRGFPPLSRSFPPNFKLILLFAVLSAPFVALSSVFVLDKLDHTVREPADVERHLGVRVLGTIRLSTPDGIASLFDDGDPVGERAHGSEKNQG